MTITQAAPPRHPGIIDALIAGLHWLYHTMQPPSALVERRGARLAIAGRVLRFVPIAAGGTPLIVVDLAAINWGLCSASPPRNALPADELPALVAELSQLGNPTKAAHYHGLMETVALERPAHPSLLQAVHRFDRGCPYHRTQVCEAPMRDGGQACTWHSQGHRAAVWPHLPPPNNSPRLVPTVTTTTPFIRHHTKECS